MGVKVKEKVEGSGVYWVFINHNGRRASKRVGTEKAAKRWGRLSKHESSWNILSRRRDRPFQLDSCFDNLPHLFGSLLGANALRGAPAIVVDEKPSRLLILRLFFHLTPIRFFLAFFVV